MRMALFAASCMGAGPPGPNLTENRALSEKRQAVWFEMRSISN